MMAPMPAAAQTAALSVLTLVLAAVQFLGMTSRNEDLAHSVPSLLFLMFWVPEIVIRLLFAGRGGAAERRAAAASQLAAAAPDLWWLAFGGLAPLAPWARLIGPSAVALLVWRRTAAPVVPGLSVGAAAERLLGKYRFELPPPERRADAVPESGESLVETGSLRVDPVRAVRTLARWQLADPAEFVLCWARLAAALEARSLAFTVEDGSVSLSCDGEPLPAQLLVDPLAALTGAGDLPGAAASELAAGLLGALRMGVRELTASSGGPGQRRTLRVAAEGVKEAPDDGSDRTVRTASWAAGDRRRRNLVRALLRARIAPFGRSVLLDGSPLGPGRDARPVALEGAQVLVGPLLPPSRGRVRLCVGGVVAVEREEAFVNRVCVTLACPGLKLDASKKRVVADEAFDRALALARSAADSTDAVLVLRSAARRRTRLLLGALACGGPLAAGAAAWLGGGWLLPGLGAAALAAAAAAALWPRGGDATAGPSR
ncbi:MAG: hypothetical protein HYV15_04530 [Elusimicrobia bacterium]|nr:hypothetical protein [Elusimicrobiota bacterium]